MSELDFIVYGIILTIALIGTTEFVIGLILLREVRNMWKIIFEIKDRAKMTVTGKEQITLKQALGYYVSFGMYSENSIYQQYPKSKNAAVTLDDKLLELWDEDITGTTREEAQGMLSRIREHVSKAYKDSIQKMEVGNDV